MLVRMTTSKSRGLQLYDKGRELYSPTELKKALPFGKGWDGLLFKPNICHISKTAVTGK